MATLQVQDGLLSQTGELLCPISLEQLAAYYTLSVLLLFSKFLLDRNKGSLNKQYRIWLNLYTGGLSAGCVSFMYFHIACGGLIQHFKVLYQVTNGDIQQATDAWTKIFLPEVLPFGMMFVAFDVISSDRMGDTYYQKNNSRIKMVDHSSSAHYGRHRNIT